MNENKTNINWLISISTPLIGKVLEFKKYDLDKIIEKVEKYKNMDLNDINPDDYQI